ncbi:ABC transporter ATP-binding protein [Prosthecomicrobium hirschii]|uniref:ABC transporter ATP-binding protein n=1 Tax=Prosthecodimorpha hirschii TaxID=665126 RepID=UPI002220D145|nr:ABC transporter ATP-binding protein [Prosthecomicrobium hirschii]
MMLAAEELSFGYRGRPVGTGLSLALRPGEVVALLGPNGGGKTTLLKTLIGLLPPIAGSITLDGTAIERLAPRERARAIGYVPQAHGGSFAFSVLDAVLMGRTAHQGLFAAPSRRDRAAAGAALDRLGLGALAARPVTEISGGERQLAMIARALAQEPRLVVLDEPTASLDFGNQGRVMAEIRALGAAGLGVLFTTHDPNQARRFADRAVLIRAGREVAAGPVDRVLTRASLEALYGAPVEIVGGAASEPTAFLPGTPAPSRS